MQTEQFLEPVTQEEKLFVQNRTLANDDLTAEEDAAFNASMGEVTMKPEGDTQAAVVPSPTPQEPSKPGMLSRAAVFIKERMSAAVENPKQTTAGVADVVSQVYQSLLDSGTAYEEWANKKGFDGWQVLGPQMKVGHEMLKYAAGSDGQLDFGHYIAAPGIDPKENMARGVGQFVGQTTAFIGAAALTGGAAVAAGAGATAAVGASAVGAGVAGFAAFDPREQRLSDVLVKHPALRNPVTEYLQSDPKDTAIEGRFKNAVENIIGDVVLAGAFAGVAKAYRGVRGVSKIAKAADDAIAPAVGSVDNAAVGATDEQILKAETTNADLKPGQIPPAPKSGEALKEPAVTAMGGKGLPSSTRAIRAVGDINIQDIAGPVKPEVAAVLEKHFNWGNNAITADDPVFKAIASAPDAPAAAKAGIVTDKAMDKRAWAKFIENPDALLARKPGAPMSPEDFRASLIGLKVSNEIAKQKRDGLLVLMDMKKQGLDVSDDVLNIARAQFDEAMTKTVGWFGAAKGTGADAARSLRAGKEMGWEALSEMEKVIVSRDRIKLAGGAGSVDEVAQMHAAIEASAEAVKHLPAVIEDSAKFSLKDSMNSIYLNVLLSNPKTHIKNTISNTIQMGLSVADRLLAVPVGKTLDSAGYVLGKFNIKNSLNTYKQMSPEAVAGMSAEVFKMPYSKLTDIQKKELFVKVAEREAYNNATVSLAENGAYLKGMIDGLWNDALKLRMMIKDGSMIVPEGAEKFSAGFRRVTSDQFAQMSNMEKALHFMGHFKTPSGALSAMDGFVGSIVTRAEQHALTSRYVNSVVRNPEQAQRMYLDLINNPPSFIREQVLAKRGELLLNSDIANNVLGKATKHFQGMIDNMPMGKAITPFISVASNMADQAVQRSGMLSALSPNFRQAWTAGGASRDMAIAKIATASVAMGNFAYLATQGRVTGNAPKDPGQRRMWEADGRAANSVQLANGKWMSLDVLGPMGSLIQFSTKLTQIGAYVPEAKKEEYEDLILSAAAAAVDASSPDYLFESMTGIQELIDNPEGKEAKRFLSRLASPGIGLGRFAVEYTDGVKRDTNPKENPWGNAGVVLNGIINNFVATIPGLSDKLPPQRNFFGEEVTYPIGHGPEISSPIAFSPEKTAMVEQELVRLGLQGQLFDLAKKNPNDAHLVLSLPDKSITVGKVNIPLTVQQYDDFQRLSAGDMEPLSKTKMFSKSDAAQMKKQMGLRNLFTEFMQSEQYKTMNDTQRKVYFNMITKNVRANAQKALIAIYPELMGTSIKGQAEKAALMGGQELDSEFNDQIDNIILEQKRSTTRGEEPTL
jgi:hypothetical protein